MGAPALHAHTQNVCQNIQQVLMDIKYKGVSPVFQVLGTASKEALEIRRNMVFKMKMAICFQLFWIIVK